MDITRSSVPTTRRTFLAASAVTAAAAVSAPLVGEPAVADASTLSAGGPGRPLTPQPPDKQLRDLLRQVDPRRLGATVNRLVAFGTRHTLSSQDDPSRGIGAARAWIFDQFQAIAGTSGGRMSVARQSFVQPPVSRSAGNQTTALTNSSTLQWTRGTEPDLAGYEVVWRETTAPDWTHVIPVGDVTTVTIDLSKDNVQFGIRAVDQDGHRSPVASPVPV